MNKNSRLHFSPVTRFHPRFARPVDSRLMLGLTARHVRRDLPVGSSIAATADLAASGLRRAAPLLDRLQAPLTRYHD